MNLQTPAILINQTETNHFFEYDYLPATPAGADYDNLLATPAETNEDANPPLSEITPLRIKVYELAERGVGLSRNTALMRADGDIILFSDEDIHYDNGYAQALMQEFEAHPEADILLFNIRVVPERKTYENTSYGRVRWYNCGRYPAYAIAARRKKLQHANVFFSLLFGGGAVYANGEDSLFLMDCLKKRLRLYKTPVCLGEEIPRPSTWFHGFDQKFFHDRGVLYHFLYGRFALLLGIRFLLSHRKEMLQDVPFSKAFLWFREGLHNVREMPDE
ncbi:MAG: glycosyltransferase family 2 protein [Lachnospiraceae bacterium]|nr:glycosyltransferase family 2 protein [Lachnospiraceae bacterium]